MSFTLFGIKIHLSFLFLALLAFSLLTDTMGIVGYGIFAIAIHETAHLIAMLLCKARPESISFGYYGIRISEPLLRYSYKKELCILLAGPCSNLLCFFIIYCLWPQPSENIKLAALSHFALGAFNLLPIGTLDGGRINSVLLKMWVKDLALAEKLSFWLSFVILLPLILYALILFFRQHNLTLLLTCGYLIFLLFKI